MLSDAFASFSAVIPYFNFLLHFKYSSNRKDCQVLCHVRVSVMAKLCKNSVPWSFNTCYVVFRLKVKNENLVLWDK